MALSEQGSTSLAVKSGDTQLVAVYYVPQEGILCDSAEVRSSFARSSLNVIQSVNRRSWMGVLIVERSFLTTGLLEILQVW